LILLHIYNIEAGAEDGISEAAAYVMVQLARMGGESKLAARK
jgi:hypothetical protein